MKNEREKMLLAMLDEAIGIILVNCDYSSPASVRSALRYRAMKRLKRMSK